MLEGSPYLPHGLWSTHLGPGLFFLHLPLRPQPPLLMVPVEDVAPVFDQQAGGEPAAAEHGHQEEEPERGRGEAAAGIREHAVVEGVTDLINRKPR